MESFKKFIIKQAHIKLNIEYVDGSKNTQSLINQLSDVSKNKIGEVWYKLDVDNENLKKHNKKYDDYNVMFVSLNNGLCVIDTDGEEEYKVIYDYLLNKCEYKMIENNVTKSSSNFEVKETFYKRHFWFVLDKEYDNIKNILGDKHGLHFDILFDKVFEHKQNYEIKEFEPCVIGISEIEELLSIIDKHFNTNYITKSSIQPPNAQNKKENIKVKHNINELREYIECLSDIRYSYSNWRDVGFALHSAIDNYDEDDLIEIFNNWSSKDKKSYKGLKDILTFWKSINTVDDGITMKTFYLWCKEDNEKLYNKLVKKYSKKLDTLESENKELYNIVKNEVEKEWFYCNYTSRYYRYYENELISYTVRDTQQYFKNKFYEHKIKVEDKIETVENAFYNDWSEDPLQRRYEKVIFNPDPNYIPNKKNYNEWNGWKLLDNNIIIDEEIIKPFIDLIKYLCNDDINIVNFILDWLSWIIQRPHKKTNVAICLYSDKHGVGKNTFIELIKRLFEDFTSKLSRIEDLGKNFNSHYDKKFFIYGDEIKATAKQWANEIKNMITETEKIIEKKGIDSKMNKCYVNYFFTTNNEINFQIEDSDRRWLLIECMQERMDKQKSHELYKYIDDDNYIKMFFNYLYRRDISNIILLEPPMTEYKQRLINQTLPGYIQYLYNNFRILANNKIYVNELYNNIIDYSKSNHLSTLFSKKLIGNYFTKLDNVILTKGRHRENGVYYTFDNIDKIETFLKLQNPSYFNNE